MHWLKNIGYTTYSAGDLWGCVGQWYSGGWRDRPAMTYIAEVKGYTLSQPWTQASFSNVAAAETMRYDFENGGTGGWYSGWGPVTVAATTNPTYTGGGALAIILKPTGPAWPAVQVSSPAALAAGTRVTYWIYQPSDAQISSVQPYIADLQWHDLFVSPVVLTAGWNQVTWIVPVNGGILGLGLEINDNSGWSGQITLDSVGW
jgi:hypothetical protein